MINRKHPTREFFEIQKNLRQKTQELHALYEISKFLSSNVNPSRLFNLLVAKAVSVKKAKIGMLYFVSPGREKLILETYYGLNKNSTLLKKTINYKSLDFSIAPRTAVPKIYRDLATETKSSYLRALGKKGYLSCISVPLVRRDRAEGILLVFSGRVNAYNKNDADTLNVLASQAAAAIENARLFKEIEESYLNTVKALTSIVDTKDSFTYGHSERVMKHTLDIAEALNLSEHDKNVLRYASLLHDVGKVGIDMSVLRKPSVLTGPEWGKILNHPEIGARAVRGITFLKELAPIILYHHARYGGGGYPDRKISREKIPLGARILAVADAYEAMVSERPYRKALSKKEAIKELIREKGKQFDPRVVQAFLKVLRKRG